MVTRTANIIGYITSAAIVVTAVLKIEHLPGAAIALCICGFMLGIYFPAHLVAKMRDDDGKILPVHIAVALSVFFIDLGVTCRIWHLPGAPVLLTIGLVGFSLVAIPMLWLHHARKTRAFNFMNTVGALALVTFSLGIWLRLQHLPGAAVLLMASPVLLFGIYFPIYLIDPAVKSEQKSAYLRDSFLVIVIGALLTLYFIKSIEIHDNDGSQPVAISSPA